MIPQLQDDLRQDFSVGGIQVSKTYKLDCEKDRISGSIDNLEAIKQAIYKILNTERYEHVIYSWNYGAEFTDLIGKPLSYAAPEIKRRIIEALTQDERIQSVDAFSFKAERGMVDVIFTVHTIFGNIDAEKKVVI